MSPRRRLLGQQTLAILDDLGIGLYVDGGVVFMGGADGGPYAPASMEAVEEACAAVGNPRAFRDATHRLEVFLDKLDSGQGLDLRSTACVKSDQLDPAASVLRLLGEPGPRHLLDDRTAELVRWERIQAELRPDTDRRPRGSGVRTRPD